MEERSNNINFTENLIKIVLCVDIIFFLLFVLFGWGGESYVIVLTPGSVLKGTVCSARN